MLKWWSLLNLVFGFCANAHAITFAEVKARDVSSELVLLDQNGTRYDSIRLDPHFRKSSWVSLESIAPAARKTLIEIEDQHFFEHDGVDWFALGNSALKTLRGKSARGASTLTMQLVSLIDSQRVKKGKRTLSAKIDQIKMALLLDQTWTKNQILEAYFNLVPLRGELIGIHATSQFLFQKEVSALDPVDSALFVAMLPAPNASWLQLSERACVFLRKVYAGEIETGNTLCKNAQERTLAYAKLNEVDASSPSTRIAEHYSRFWLKTVNEAEKTPGPHQTTLDLKLQQKTHDLAKDTLLSISKNNVREIAALVLDNRTGSVVTYLGNLSELSKSPQVDGIQAKRQAGSTLKPFFYGVALQNKKFDLNSQIIDEPIQIETTNGSFRPENYDKKFHGSVSLSVALAASMNIPAIKVVQAISVEDAVNTLKKLNFHDLKEPYIYGASIALGTVDLSLYELTRAYQQLAEQAFGTPSKTFPFDRESALKISRILSDDAARSLTFGLNSVLNTPYFTAVKTGTSKDMRDNWCVGFSEHYTVGVWVGNFSGVPMEDVSGVSGAAPLWRKIMDELNRHQSSAIPQTVARISLSTPEIAQRLNAKVEHFSLAHITYPSDGSLLAYDVEIPENRQKVLFTASSHDSKKFWYLNHEKQGSLEKPYLWSLSRGTYTIEIRDLDGALLDQTHFKVR